MEWQCYHAHPLRSQCAKVYISTKLKPYKETKGLYIVLLNNHLEYSSIVDGQYSIVMMDTIDDEWRQYLCNQGKSSSTMSTIPSATAIGLSVKGKGQGTGKGTEEGTQGTGLGTKGTQGTGQGTEKGTKGTGKGTSMEGTKGTGLGTSTDGTEQGSIPLCDDLYISTKTKVLFFNQSIDINRIFWDIPVIEYWRPETGVVKKQIKIVSKTQEEFDAYRAHLVDIPYYTEHVIKQINNPSARRIKFKDERKITIGVSKKDIMNCRGKVKNAFYNCFAMILRFPYEGTFREIHVKIFNTGKMEIPGILHDDLLDIAKSLLLTCLRPLISSTDGLPLDFVDNTAEDSVLINSNFNCGFYIHRERLYSILRSEKYNIEAAYDSCSYPGVKCKFYFNHEIGLDPERQRGYITKEDYAQTMSQLGENRRYTEVSFMIFRTGSCLIVGNCSETILRFIYDFIKTLLMTEYDHIVAPTENPINKNKILKIRKRMAPMTPGYFNACALGKTGQ